MSKRWNQLVVVLGISPLAASVPALLFWADEPFSFFSVYSRTESIQQGLRMKSRALLASGGPPPVTTGGI